MLLRQQVFDLAIRGIDNFIIRYKNNPISYIYEDDLKCEIYASIKNSLDSAGLLYAPKNWLVCKNHQTSTAVQLVHSEQKMGNNLIDVAVWDPESVFNVTANYNQKECLLLIEVKQNCKSIDLIPRLYKDFIKISKFTLSPIASALALGFCTDSLPKQLQLCPLKKLEENILMDRQAAVIVAKDGIAFISLIDVLIENFKIYSGFSTVPIIVAGFLVGSFFPVRDGLVIPINIHSKTQGEFEEDLRVLLKILEGLKPPITLIFQRGGPFILPDWFFDICNKLGIKIVLIGNEERLSEILSKFGIRTPPLFND